MEEWRKIRYDVYHHDGVCKYSVSNLGRVRNDKTGLILKTQPTSAGRQQVLLRIGGKYSRKQVAHLVAQEFIVNCLKVIRVKHLDGDLSNCRADNLEVVSFHKYYWDAPGEAWPYRYVDRQEE